MNISTPRRPAHRLAAVLAAALVLIASALAWARPAHAAPALPGGKANWVVSVGSLNPSARSGYRNWVRLGYYTFAADGTASASHWRWNQQDQPTRVAALTADCGGAVPTCSVRTLPGFAGNPTGSLKGTYTSTADGRLAVTWNRTGTGAATGPFHEYWTVQSGLASGGVARITSPGFYGAYGAGVTVPAAGAFTDYGATFGVGYGSNASLGRESRATMAALLKDPRYDAQPYKGAYVVAKASSSDPATRTGIVAREGAGGSWTTADPANPWRLCSSGLCAGWVQPGTSCGGTDKARVRYLAEIGGGRRTTEEYWCRSLAQGKPCYVHNSHPRPMLQVVDDAGVFRGWVGVEGFTHVRTTTGLPDGSWIEGYWGVFDMVSATLQPKLP
ncbi:hypothetical protein [Streptomyces sp. NPDC001380]|uniref:hypothetical protein n=1 Tax=Streptomyces sp. NPDC001380 TaxID=3364566 RepID=UPI0036A36D89